MQGYQLGCAICLRGTRVPLRRISLPVVSLCTAGQSPLTPVIQEYVKHFSQLSGISKKTVRTPLEDPLPSPFCAYYAYGKYCLPRKFSSSVQLFSKKIQEVTEGETTTVEGVHVPQPESSLCEGREVTPGSACTLCRLDLQLNYTDVLLLQQFTQRDGHVLPRYVTGLCVRQHLNVLEAVRKAHKAGLLNNRKPWNFQKDQSKRRTWRKYNVWYDEHKLHLPWFPRKSS